MLRKGVTTIICFFILLNFIIITVPETTKAISTIAVELRWAEGQEVQEADVAPGSDGNVTFHGTASCDIAAGGKIDQIKYILFADAGNWNTQVNPNEIIFTPECEELPFLVNVSVPIGTSCYTSRTLKVHGIATTYPDNITYTLQPTTGTIKIKLVYNFKIKANASDCRINKGEKATYQLNIKNIGNGRDKLKLEIKNMEEHYHSGIKLYFQDTFELEPNSTKYLNLIVKSSDFTKAGKYKLELSLRSTQEELNEGSSESKNLTVLLKVQDDIDNFNPFISVLSFLFIFILLIFLLKLKRWRE